MNNVAKRILTIVIMLLAVGCIACVRSDRAQAMSIEYLLGMLVGVAVGLIIVAVATGVIRKLGGKVDFKCNKDSYDERQMLARGLACKYAYTTLSIGVIMAGLLSEMAGIHWFMSFGGICVLLGLSVAVFITVCIVKDAYMSMYENVKGIVMLFVLCIGVNLIPSIMYVVENNPLIADGRLTMNCLNLGIVVLFVYILIVFLARVRYNDKQLAEDEE